MDINNMAKWLSIWCLYFNRNMCNTLHNGKIILIVIISCLLVKLIINERLVKLKKTKELLWIVYLF